MFSKILADLKGVMVQLL